MANVSITLEELRNQILNTVIPVGTISFFYGTTEPEGWVIADGRAIPDKYPKLKAIFGNNMPDWRGRFFRMIGGNAGSLGTLQGDAIRNMTGNAPFHGATAQGYVTNPSGVFWGSPRASSAIANGGGSWSGGSNHLGFDASRQVPTANENRPVNVAVNVIVYGGGV